VGKSRIARGAVSRGGALALAIALGGCVDAATDVSSTELARQPIERRADVSLAAATVAIVSVDGAPDSVAAGFSADLAREAKSRQITVVEPRKARYLARGYLSATSTADGADFEYVWDIFGPDRTRRQRLNDVIAVKGSAGDDPWSLADSTALSSVAASSADDLAAFLSNTPDAKPLPRADATQALGFAPTQ
jgi:hypothetical protein